MDRLSSKSHLQTLWLGVKYIRLLISTVVFWVIAVLSRETGTNQVEGLKNEGSIQKSE